MKKLLYFFLVTLFLISFQQQAQAFASATGAQLQAEIDELRTKPTQYAAKIGKILDAVKAKNATLYRQLTGSPWGFPDATRMERWKTIQAYLVSAKPVSSIVWQSATSTIGQAAKSNSGSYIFIEEYNLGGFYWACYSHSLHDMKRLRSATYKQGAAYTFKTTHPKARVAFAVDPNLFTTPYEWLAYLSQKSTLSTTEQATVRAKMLLIANTGRNNSNYRSKNKYASNLTGTTTKTEDGVEKLYRASGTMVDLALNDKLNQIAQIQAEHNASNRSNSHTGPSNYKGKDLRTLGARFSYVGYTSSGAEAAGSGSLDLWPTRWMSGESHYRPFFNINDNFIHIGFGFAKGSDGKWYVVAVFGTKKS